MHLPRTRIHIRDNHNQTSPSFTLSPYSFLISIDSCTENKLDDLRQLARDGPMSPQLLQVEPIRICRPIVALECLMRTYADEAPA